MQELNFPTYSFRFKNSENKLFIFDIVRKKFVFFTPEEWVRQHTIHYLIIDKKIPISLINVEKNIKINGLIKRYDVVVYQSNGKINLLVECKASSVEINQNVFDQIARYNMVLEAQYLMITNGLQHYYCKIDFDAKTYVFLKELPKFSTDFTK